jgi:hypothetical protein
VHYAGADAIDAGAWPEADGGASMARVVDAAPPDDSATHPRRVVWGVESDGEVGVAYDREGNAWHAPGVDLMRNVTSAHIALVVSVQLEVADGERGLAWWSRGTTAAGSRVYLYASSTEVGIGMRRLDGDSYTSASWPVTWGNTDLVEVVIDWSARTAEVLVGGVSVGTLTGIGSSGGATSDTASQTSAIGSTNDNAGDLTGIVHAVWVWSGADVLDAPGRAAWRALVSPVLARVSV